MQKTYVLDTNVLIHDPKAIYNFKDNTVIIPYPVIEELDKLKKAYNGKSQSARKAIREIEKLTSVSEKKIINYFLSGYICSLENKGKIIVTGKIFDLEYQQSSEFSVDDVILKYILLLKNTSEKIYPEPVIFVTKDISLRIKATLFDIEVQDYKTDKTSAYQMYGNIYSVDEDSFSTVKSLFYFFDKNYQWIYKVKNGQKIEVKPFHVLNIKPKNLEQACAIDALTDKDIDVVVLNGYAGTGKTLLALACGIQQVLKGIYEQVIVIRPVIPIFGADIGYLPGDVKEKMKPWVQPIYDNLEIIAIPNQNINQNITVSKKKKNKEKQQTQEEDQKELIQIEALTYIRGRSLPNRYIIVDEAQNLRPLDIKTIITRAGEGTKIVFTGDLEQIDTPYLDAESSGLAYLVDRFINQENFCYLYMKDTVRSKLAEQGARLL